MTLLAHDAERGARLVEDDPWLDLSDETPLPSHGDVVVPLARLADVVEAPGRLAARVDGASDPELLAPHLHRLALIVVEIPKFTDGRAYSLARLLRSRHGYRGELRAVGYVLRDQLFYLWRCGFDSFALAPGKDPADALAAFTEWSVTYQPAEDHDVPIWRRRRAG
ncbi:MAG: DUF934 domain-containing protein [Sandaracinaceae bacterium]|nr:DUF934 domain-containing protein [Sandaracinaceae bacterium]